MGLINKLEVTVLPQSSFSTEQKAVARNNIGALGIDEYNSDVELFNNVYNTVNSNSATWNESGGTTYSAGSNINITNDVISGKDWSNEINAKLDTTAYTPSSGIEDVTTSGSYLRTSAGWTEYNEPDQCTLSRENFVEWNFTRSASQTRAAHPLLALSDTSGTQSGTLNAGDKYMIYVDGLIGQSGTNNTFVNFGIQSDTVSGQYLLAEPLPSKKLCRSTSTGNDFACAFMFTVPTNGTYSVSVQPTENNQEYKFFGNTTVRQIKIG